MKELSLPSWATRDDEASPVQAGKVSIVVNVDTKAAYDEWFKLLSSTEYPEQEGVTRMDTPSAINQYWLETAYQCAKLDVQAALVGTEFDPRTANKPAEIHFSNCPDLALAKWPPGDGILAATKGRQARRHYRRIRGSLPF